MCVIINPFPALGLSWGQPEALLWLMDSISRYHLSLREDGEWNVIDSKTGRPAELRVNDDWFILYGLPKEVAELWPKRLNKRQALLGSNYPTR